MQPIIEACFSGNGFFNEGEKCVYIIVFSNSAGQKKYYVGRTGTSNNTGISAPFKRLASHLAMRGQTYSCIWSNDENGINPLHEENFLENFHFYAIYVKNATLAEKWLLFKMRDFALINARNTIPAEEPSCSIKKQLEHLLNKAKSDIPRSQDIITNH